MFVINCGCVRVNTFWNRWGDLGITTRGQTPYSAYWMVAVSLYAVSVWAHATDDKALPPIITIDTPVPATNEIVDAVGSNLSSDCDSEPEDGTDIGPTTESVPPTADSPCATLGGHPTPLDIDQLITRLKETKAIGVLTKLALKGDVNKIVRQTAQHSKNQASQELSELRERFEGLVLKTIALLGEKDPILAQDIYQARHFVWQSMLEVKG